MKKENPKKLCIAVCLLTSFVLWTVLICFIDVKQIGPKGSRVGFATLNGFVHNLTGVNSLLYIITDWLGIIPIGFVFVFGIYGLLQWVNRKSLFKVDRDLIALGVFYTVVAAVYVLFEILAINYRPVLIDGYLEASYPSSTTMLVISIMPTAIMQIKRRIKNTDVLRCVTVAIYIFIAFMIIGRLVSGVHWFTDIIGSLMLGTGLLMLYRYVSRLNFITASKAR